MKSTFSQLPSFWVKVLPLMLVLLSIGLTRTQAQNYKPLNEAVTSVSNSIDVLQHEGGVKAAVPKINNNGNGQATTSSLTPSQANAAQQKTFEIAYFNLFIEKTKRAASVAQGVIDLDAAVNSQGQSGSRVTVINAAKAHLMTLITN